MAETRAGRAAEPAGARQTGEKYLKHAWGLYQKSLNAREDAARRYLREAMNILEYVPDGTDGKSELAEKIAARL